MTEIDENVKVCWRCAYNGGIALPAISLPNPKLVKQTAKKIGGTYVATPFFGGKIAFSQAWIDKVKRTGPEYQA